MCNKKTILMKKKALKIDKLQVKSFRTSGLKLKGGNEFTHESVRICTVDCPSVGETDCYWDCQC